MVLGNNENTGILSHLNISPSASSNFVGILGNIISIGVRKSRFGFLKGCG